MVSESPQFEKRVPTITGPGASLALTRQLGQQGRGGPTARRVFHPSQHLPHVSSFSLSVHHSVSHEMEVICKHKICHFSSFLSLDIRATFSLFLPVQKKEKMFFLFLGEASCSPYSLSSSDGSVLFLVSLVFLPAPSHLLVNKLGFFLLLFKALHLYCFPI